MNILVLSDTHGELGRALEMYKRISTLICKIDRIIHCGDFIKDAHELKLKLAPLLAVHLATAMAVTKKILRLLIPLLAKL